MSPLPPAGPQPPLAADGPDLAAPPAGLLPGLALRDYVLPFKPRPLALWVLKDPLALAQERSEEAGAEVYWGELWPASIALADALLRGDLPLPAGAEPILELGCGVGLDAVAAALAGAGRARILASDREERALLLTAANARRNGVGEWVRTKRLDWQEPYIMRHRLILASDCLYRPEGGRELLAFLRQALDRQAGDEARAVVVDPDRWSARGFVGEAQREGFRVKVSRRVVPFTAAHGAVQVPQSGPPSDAEVRSGQSLEAAFYELTWA